METVNVMKMTNKLPKLVMTACLMVSSLFVTAQAKDLDVGKKAPQLMGLDHALESKVKLKDYKSELKIIHFWNSELENSKSTLTNLVNLQRAADQKGVNIKVFAVNVDQAKVGSRINNFYDAKSWVESYDESSVVFTYDKRSKVKKKYRLSYFPTAFLVDANDKLISQWSGDNNVRRITNMLVEKLELKDVYAKN